MSTIYVQREGQKWGPFTTEELEGKVAAGEFCHDDLFWSEGMEEWQPLRSVVEIESVEEVEESPLPEATEEALEPSAEQVADEAVEQVADSPDNPLFDMEETHILYDSPEARLTSEVLHLGGEDLPIHMLVKAEVEIEKIHRFRPILGSIILGVAAVCVALAEVRRPHMTAWLIWGAILAVLLIWFLRTLSTAIRPGATLMIVDLRDGDERILRTEPAQARELAEAINQAIIAAFRE